MRRELVAGPCHKRSGWKVIWHYRDFFSFPLNLDQEFTGLYSALGIPQPIRLRNTCHSISVYERCCNVGALQKEGQAVGNSFLSINNLGGFINDTVSVFHKVTEARLVLKATKRLYSRFDEKLRIKPLGIVLFKCFALANDTSLKPLQQTAQAALVEGAAGKKLKPSLRANSSKASVIPSRPGIISPSAPIASWRKRSCSTMKCP